MGRIWDNYYKRDSSGRPPRGFARFVSVVWLVGLFSLGGTGLVKSFEKDAWPQTEGTVTSREVDRKGWVSFTVDFVTADGHRTVATVEKVDADHRVSDKVRIRYSLNNPGEAELTEQPAVPTLLVAGLAVMLVAGLGLAYWAWRRMPPDEPPNARDELTFKADY
ncbi:DUF3592 domain-containing protein [Kibdelosporangium aridum]|uniref:DUF3592 domain-containing protein n=1 Tax=Kibdelosporangium aridum TaxID=2030 RepID=A0A428ZTU1_KIBAR|nr:DUF3592 domain-containing protein [Kibdelosporangium aridum]RSM91504.1 DUF3592 domain-containing protein [Kibdelosporangium aridum]